MDIQYSNISSEIMEQCMLPIFLGRKEEWEWDFSHKEEEILRDVLPVLEELHTLFLPYREKIERYHLMGYGLTLLQFCYLDMVEEGKEVQGIEEVHAYALTLSKEKIQELLTLLLNTEMEHMEEDWDFGERLERSTAKPATKWHMSQFYKHPLASMQELVALSRELVPLYAPYLEKSREERRQFAADFSLEELLKESGYLSQFDLSRFDNRRVSLYILSPWLIRFASYGTPDVGEIFLVSSRVEQLLQSHKDLDLDTFTTVLKTMSDVTRYNVLLELTKPHAKSKDVAEALDITGAAVSFHTQKLINAQLLLFNRKDKDIKYNVNKTLLREIIEKLEVDFHLEEDK